MSEAEDIFADGMDTTAAVSNHWVYEKFSTRGGDFAGKLPTRVVRDTTVHLEFNSTDAIILQKVKLEIKQSLLLIRLKLFGSENKK